jgi:triacylglycerol lipase
MSEYLDLAILAYQNPTTDVLCMVQPLTISAVKAFFYDALPKSDAQFYTIVFEDKLVFVFRGSSSAQDFIIDTNIFMSSMQEIGNNAMVHSGFYSQFNTIKYEVLSSVFTFVRKHSRSHIVFVGHSLGGALATLCAATTKALLNDKVIVTCETFGSPRVGNSTFVRFFISKIEHSIRVVNGNDIVTMLPRFRYEHVKGEKRIGYRQSDFISMYFGDISDHYTGTYKDSSLKKKCLL